MKKGPARFRIRLAGEYQTRIFTPDGVDVTDSEGLSPDLRGVDIQWSQASFVGRHWLLGEVRVELQPVLSTGTVVPSSENQETLFPAINKNEFYFQIHMSRLNRDYVNRAPLVNSSIINSIPPIGSLYELEQSVRFENPVNPGDWADITKCYVMMPDQKWIAIDVVSIAREADRFRVTASLTNKSPLRWVAAYWFTHTDEPYRCHYEPRRGRLFLGRRSKLINFDFVWTEPPEDPVIQIGAAVITNPDWHDPNQAGGTGTLAINVNKRLEHLSRRVRR